MRQPCRHRSIGTGSRQSRDGERLTDGCQIMLMTKSRLKRKQVAEDGLSRLAQTIFGQLPMVPRLRAVNVLVWGPRLVDAGVSMFRDVVEGRERRVDEQCDAVREGGKESCAHRTGRMERLAHTPSTEYQGERLMRRRHRQAKSPRHGFGLGETKAGWGWGQGLSTVQASRSWSWSSMGAGAVRDWEERREVLQPIWA